MTTIFRHPNGPYLGSDVRQQREVPHKTERAATPGGAVGDSTPAESPRTLTRALATTFGDSITQAVMRELGMGAASDRLLTASDIDAAVAACGTSMLAISGLNFASHLLMSARADTPAFRTCADRLGVATQVLSDEDRAAIDLAFDREMELATSGGRDGVDLRDAGSLMRRAISAIVPGAGG
jgi:hypothetical protein